MAIIKNLVFIVYGNLKNNKKSDTYMDSLDVEGQLAATDRNI